MDAIILAGGFGTRLQSRVSEVPKPMAPVAGRPFLEYLLDQLARDGFARVVLSVGHKAAVIRHHFGRTYRGIDIAYAVENEPLGTGGALQFAFEFLENQQDDVLVLNGDTYLDLDFRALTVWFRRSNAEVAMVLRAVQNAGRYGRVEVTENRVTRFLEKGDAVAGLINAGVYVLKPSALTRLKLGPPFSLERDFFETNLGQLNIAPYVSDNYFVDIGVPEDFDRAQLELPQNLRRGNAS